MCKIIPKLSLLLLLNWSFARLCKTSWGLEQAEFLTVTKEIGLMKLENELYRQQNHSFLIKSNEARFENYAEKKNNNKFCI